MDHNSFSNFNLKKSKIWRVGQKRMSMSHNIRPIKGKSAFQICKPFRNFQIKKLCT